MNTKSQFAICTVMGSVFLSLSSCTKVIPLDLNSSNPAMVVDGAIINTSGTTTINLTRSVNFSDNNEYPFVSDANVIVTDNEGNTATFIDAGSGNYINSSLVGVPGRVYTLSVYHNGQTYVSVSTMPAVVGLDSLIVEPGEIKGGGNGGGSSNYQLSVKARFTDRAGEANHYRIVPYVNGVPDYSTINIISDYLQDASTITTDDLMRGITLQQGDTITVVLQNIDEDVYKYYNTMKIITRTKTGISAAVPGNPSTNITNNGLGVFSAQSVSVKKVVAP